MPTSVICYHRHFTWLLETERNGFPIQFEISFLNIICSALPAGLDQSLMGQMGPISPPDLKPDLNAEMKPDMSMLNGNSMSGFSPISGSTAVGGNGNNNAGGSGGGGGGPGSPGGGNGGYNAMGGMQHSISTSTSPGGGQTRSPYPPNHPLSGSKHLCSICGDRASGKHYGVYR